MMKHLALGLLVLAGCMDDYSPEPARDRRTPDPSATCPGNDCMGMHIMDPKAKCAACGLHGLPLTHLYCTACAAKLERCPHCGRKSPAKSAERQETPSPPPPKPQAKKPAAGENLVAEPVDLSDEHRRSHSVIVFAAENERARSALDTHRRHKEAEIAKLPSPQVQGDPGLYLVWGHYPPPNITEKDVKAVLDKDSGTIRVTVPLFRGHRRDGGIGMDWGVDKDKTWPFVGFRVKLSTLPAGTYSFEVIEVDSLGKNPRVLTTGNFDLKSN